MIVYNFYKFQLISTNNKLNFDQITNNGLLLNVIETLQKTYKDVNFIKFFVGYGGIVFLSDRDIGDYNKLSIIATNSYYRPRYYSSALIKIDKLNADQIKEIIIRDGFIYKKFSYYEFGPNPKSLSKQFTKYSLGHIAEQLYYDNYKYKR